MNLDNKDNNDNDFNVLSFFDGMSCGQLALKKLGINVSNYYACEIDKYATTVTTANFPNTHVLGDVTKVFAKDLPKINLFIGGSPCQGFSFAGKQLNFNDPRSKLFFEFVRMLKEIRETNPDVHFLLENVKMKKEFQDIITEHLGVEPIEINSNLYSAQNRKRIYWTNITKLSQPEDKGILLSDIIHENNGEVMGNMGDDKTSSKICVNLDEYMVPFNQSLLILDRDEPKGKLGYFRGDSQANRVYHNNGKGITLCGEAGGGAAKMGQYLFGTIKPSDHLNKEEGKLYTHTISTHKKVVVDGYIRKLTPIEAERLQNAPDNYTNHVSNAQRYKMLGNGWTVDIIAYIFGFINK